MSDERKLIAELSPAKRRALARRLLARKEGTEPTTRIPPRLPGRGPWPLSFGQERLWFLTELEPESRVYNLRYALRFRGELAPQGLAFGLREVIRRHESLRTTLVAHDGKPAQVIHDPPPAFTLPIVTLERLPATAHEAAVKRVTAEIADRRFDLARGPLMRALLMRLTPTEHILVLAIHHIISDGWSLGVLVHEVSTLYEAWRAGRAAPLGELPIQVADFALWQRQWLQGDVLESQLAYWRQKLADAPPLLELPTDRPRALRRSYRGTTRTLRLGPALSAALKARSSAEHGTLFVTLLSGFAVLLGRLSGQSDVMVGSPIANRRRTELEGLIGFLLNTLILRLDLDGDPRFIDFVGRVREVSLEAFAHQDLPFAKLVEEIQPERNVQWTPLFQVLFVLQNAAPGTLRLPDVEIETLETEDQAEDLDFSLFLMEEDDELVARLKYSVELYDDTTIRRLLRRLQSLLREIVAEPRQRLSSLSLLLPAECQQLLVEWNDTACEIDPAWRGCVHELFAAQAKRTPDAVALVFDGHHLSYHELNRRADQLARRLPSEGIVGLCVERSPGLLVGVLGILKAGAAYLPLDPTYPAERLAFMIADSQAPVVVSERRLIAELPEGAQVVLLDEEAKAPPTGPVSPVASDLAYVIYTSGSTGQPKGVQIRHRTLIHFLAAMAERPGLEAGDVLVAVTSLAFDIAALELFLPLLSGARVVLASAHQAADGTTLRDLLARSQATVMQATPATWRLLLDAGWDGRPALRVLCGGEALPPELAGALRGRGASLWNLYGPTETTIWSLVERLSEERVLIGLPIANTRSYLFDRRLRPVPIGVTGELYLGGEGLARGYLARPVLTAERFVPDPYAARQGDRLYRTGDLARALPDGRLDFLGRVDHQIKLRGHRIELGEVEAVLGRHPGVDATAVAVRDERLVAYFVPAGDPPPATETLRRFLGESLPDSMVPSIFVPLEELPLTPNRKLDRAALDRIPLSRRGLETAFVPPTTELEESLAAIWREVLGLEKVGLDDNFFDVGGHSLLLAQVRARVSKLMGRDVPLMELFRHPNLRSLAAFLSGEDEGQPEKTTAPAVHIERLGTEIAIIGMSGRFPGASSVEELWDNLCAGVESIRRLSDEELEAAGVTRAVYRASDYVRACADVRDPDHFDAAFFGFSPREAEILDPQHRVFLECAWHALEAAGYDPARYRGRIGVYAGAGMGRYAMNVFTRRELLESLGAAALGFAVGHDFLAPRVSYKLNLTGPSVVVQTACSTSLVAVHEARQALLDGECDMALAGGVTLLEVPPQGYRYLEGGIQSPDGHCRAFDAAARGTVSGSGAGVVLLKRLADALADGDRIHAVVKGTAINNDGARKVGFTAPSEEGQAAVIRAALEAARVDPETITCVEAHGTGTALGDPIEVSALTRAFREHTQRRGFCALGSVKTNIGHVDTAAGVAGLIAAALAVEHAVLPPSLHFERPNPAIDFAETPFYVRTERTRWETDGGTPRRAAVSSFGIGGTNAHAILEQPPPREPSGPGRPWQLLALSARSRGALETATDNLARHLRRHPEAALDDLAYTLHLGRAAFEDRRILVCHEAEEAAATLESRDRRRLLSRTVARDQGSPPVVFLFPGQGAQYVGMGRELYATEATFRREVDRCCERLEPEMGVDIREVISLGSATHGRTRRSAPTAAMIEQTAMAQPAIFVVEYALARLWMSWGVRPQAMLGHSIGEYVAATLAGVMTPEEALPLVAARGRLMQETADGKMVSVALPATEVTPRLGEDLALAAILSPGLCVVSGPTAAVDALMSELAQRRVEIRPLETTRAFHSVLMEPILNRFRAEVGKVGLKAPRLAYLSNLTGTWIRAEEATDPDYWVRQLRGTVQFSAGLKELLSQSGRILLEVGPGRTLSALVRQHPGARAGRFFSSLHRTRQLLPQTLGQLWLAGVDVDWEGFYADQHRRRVPLPLYPFERQRYWIDAAWEPAPAPRRREDLRDWFAVPDWRQSALPATPAAVANRWLLFTDDCGLGEEMARQLTAAGAAVVTVEPGTAFTRRAPGRYAVRSAARADYEALWTDLESDGGIPEHWVHLWNVNPADTPAQVLERSFYSLLSQVQALGRRTPAVEIGIVSTAVQTVTGDEPVYPEKAALLGPCRIIPQEYPHLRCRSIDVDLDADGSLEATARQLIAELRTVSSDPVIAYRDGVRWVQRFVPAPLGPPSEQLPLRPQGVYLITGGLGGLGLVVARFLAEACRARLVLTSRREATGERIRQLRELEEFGAEVLVEQADVADEQAMRRIISAATDRWGGLHGVIHAAGVAGGGVIQLKRRETAAEVIRPKVEGTRALVSVLEATPLDFLLFFSSINALVGTFGQVDYCAANNVLDAFARHHQARRPKLRTVAINWGPWREVGMAAAAARAVAHPLLDRVTGTAERMVFLTELRAAEHWVLREHRVLDRPTPPGTTYLEMARAAFAERTGHLRAELRDVLFLTPLAVDDDERREVRTVLEKSGDGFDFRVASRGEPGWQEHARGWIGPLSPAEPRRWPVEEIAARCSATAPDRVSDDDGLVRTGPRWQSLKRVHLGTDEALVLLELGEEYAGDLDHLALHPALLDLATGLGRGLAEWQDYLPMSYRRLELMRPLPGKFYSYLRHRDKRRHQPTSTRETLTVDVRLLDLEGVELVVIEQFTMKRVGPAAARLAAASAAVGLSAEVAGIGPEEGVEALRRILSHHRGPQIVATATALDELAAARPESAVPVGERHQRPEVSTEYEAPRSPIEDRLAEVWQDLLGIERIGIHDDFIELGGHSLLAVQMASQLREKLGVTVSLPAVFEAQTIAELAEVIGETAPSQSTAPAIVRVAREREGVPLSFSQERLWFLAELEPESAAYNLPQAFRLEGPLRIEALERSLEEIVNRHEPLRTTFTDAGAGPVQVIHTIRSGRGDSEWEGELGGRWRPLAREGGWEGRERGSRGEGSGPVTLPIIDLTRAGGEAEALRLMRREAARPFDLTHDPMLRAHLLVLGHRDHLLLETMHHVAADFWSQVVFLRELSELYAAFTSERPPRLADLPIQYADFAVWQRRWLSGEALEEQIAWWREQLDEGGPPAAELPSDRPRPPVETFAGDRRWFTLDPELRTAIGALSHSHGTTLFMTVLAAFQALLHRYTGQTDLTIGTPVAGRTRPEVEGLIGVFINNLALRTELVGDLEFGQLLERTRTVALRAFAHQELPFEKLVGALRPQRDLARAPLFQLMFILHNTPADYGTADLPGMTLRALPIDPGTAIYDLTLTLYEPGESLSGWFEYKTDLFEAATIARMEGHFRNLIRDAIAAPNRRLAELAVLSSPERHQLLAEWNDTGDDVSEASIHALIADQARTTPERVAVRRADAILSYGELDRRSDRMAGLLARRGIGAESLVAVALEPTPELVVALLGVLKAGGAYLPLDLSYPRERLATMLDDSGAAVLVTSEPLRPLLPDFPGPVLYPDDDWEPGVETPPAPVGLESLAYVIYTSGSTGRPKGVRISHLALVNFLSSMRRRPGLDPKDRLLAVTPLAFDISGLELWLPLITGATVELIDRETAADGDRLRAHLADATVMQATPATWHLLLATGWRGDEGLKALCGGEALSPRLAAELLARTSSTWNMYGPTESTIWSSTHPVEAADEGTAVTIGRPIANTTFHVVDRGLRPQPAGVPGDLLIGGAGLAQGYHGRPDLTAERFVPDPFGDAGRRLYRTGDLVRRRDDGRIDFLGRIDHQVKLRGFRIELGEIESRLAAHPAVAAAVVVVRGATEAARLVAYLLPAGDAEPEAGDLRRHLRESLPAYMVPAAFVPLRDLPLLPNGKVDRAALVRRALPEEPAQPEPGYAAPEGELEEALAGIWREVLGVGKIGLLDNFFDAGGHSLLLVQVRNKMRERLGCDVALVELFRYPTIRALADHLGGAAAPVTRPERTMAATAPELAIIGMSCRFPGAEDVETFWRNLCAGVESIRRLGDDELRAAGAEAADSNYVPACADLKDPDLFDAGLFGFSPREAEMIDPQQRIFLECAWEALEAAGYAPGRFPGRIGIYAGAGMTRYAWNVFNHRELVDAVGAQALTFSVGQDYLASRVSYKLGLTGPSVVVQTACSTSLVAVHLARQALLEGDCDMALVGGVTLMDFQPRGYRFLEGGILSPDGHCRAFDAGARGTVFGSGAGVLVLRRLADAVAAGDHVHAVVKGTAINNDGSLKVGYTAPSEEGQSEVIRDALAAARVDPTTVSYVEAHGTGTALGDPIELAALTRVFREHTDRVRFCGIGSVKTNIGHTDTAAGAAGLIKTTLALEHGLLPPSLNFEIPNPEIDFDGGPFRVITETCRWQTDGQPRRAGVSSFGIGGTNAHVVLEQAPPAAPSGPSRPWQLLVLSAATATAREAMTARLADDLRADPEKNLADVAFTCQVGRRRLPYRRVLVCGGQIQDAVAALDHPREHAYDAFDEHAERSVVFLFSGLGDHYPGMARELYEHEPLFRAEVDRCCERLQPELGLDLRALLFPAATGRESTLNLRALVGRGAPPDAAGPLAATRLAQPAVFVVELALARLLQSWGVEPRAMIGYSLGEFTAACVASVFSVEEALTLVAERARLIDELPAGAMLAVALPPAEVEPLLAVRRSFEELALAATNGPAVTVVAGSETAIERLERRLAAAEKVCRRLRTGHAFHSPMMRPIVPTFRERLRRVSLRPPRIPYLSNLTGTWITAAEATDPEYWVRHLCEPVRFAEGLGQLIRDPEPLLLEVGPGQALATAARQHPELPATKMVLASLPDERQRQGDLAFLFHTLGRLWAAGVAVDWDGFQRHEDRRRLRLPGYPFERRRFWIDADTVAVSPPAGRKAQIADWFYLPAWKPCLAPAPEAASGPWLLFADEAGVAARVARQLAVGDQRQVTLVHIGTGYALREEGIYEIDPERPEDYRALFAALAEHGRLPRRVAHFLSLPPAPADAFERRFAAAQARGLYSLLLLTRELVQVVFSEPITVTVVASGVVGVAGGDPPEPEKATLIGAIKVIPQEYGNLSCRLVDVPAPASGGAEEALIAQVSSELVAAEPEPVVAWRGRRRYRQSFEATPIPSSPTTAGGGLRREGVVLLTGGLGNIGLTLAEYLARTVAARLVLVGRSPLPPPEAWERLAGDGETKASLRAKLTRLRALEAAGAEVLVLAADVADRGQMALALSRARARFGALHGVIHLAGIFQEGAFVTLDATDREVCRRQFRPKVQGLVVLDELLADQPLDFRVLFSSLSVILGGLGFAAYAAANSFMDAFAQAGDRWLSVNWDAWDLGREEPEGAAGLGQSLAAFRMQSEEATEALRRVLALGGVSQIVVSTGELAARLDTWAQPAAEQAEPTVDVLSSKRRPELSHAYMAPRNEIEHQIVDAWQTLLGIDPIGIHDNFLELGGNSLLGVQLIARLTRIFQRRLTLEDLFAEPTVAALAGRLAGDRPEAQEEASAGEAIVPVPRSEQMPTSFGQRRLWFLEQVTPDHPANKVTVPVVIEEAVDQSLLTAAVNEVVCRHEILRTSFPAVDGQPVQVIAPRLELAVPLVDLGALTPAARALEARRVAVATFRSPFDLSRAPLLRISLLRLAEEEYVFFLYQHHIITDGWSIGILLDELSRIYRALAAGSPKPDFGLPALPVQYADYAVAQHRWLQGENLERLTDWWRQRMDPPPAPLPLPCDRPRVPQLPGQTTTSPLPPDPALGPAVHAFTPRGGSSRFMVMLAAFKALLHRITRHHDICVGTFVAGRGRPELDSQLGFFVNTLALRTDLGADLTFDQLLQRVREVTVGAFEHQDLPFEMLLDALPVERSVSHTPLFQTMLVLQNMPRYADAEMRQRQLAPSRPVAGFDLGLWLDDEERLSGYLEYQPALFDPTTIRRLAGHFNVLVRTAIADPRRRLSDLPLMTAAEQHQVLHEWSIAGAAGEATSTGIHQLFEDQVTRDPEAVAIVDGERRLNYRRLNADANRLARCLRRRGVGPEQVVAICLDLRSELLVAVLAVLKAGAAYLNLDPDYPPQRLTFMLADSGASLLLCRRRLIAELPAAEVPIVCFEADQPMIAGHPDDHLDDDDVHPDQPAYVVYTSGSLGRPKGVIVSHRALTVTYRGWEQDYRLRDWAGRHLQMASPSFDVFSGDWTRALCSGGRLVACPRELLLDPARLYELMVREQVDCAEFVPAVAGELLAYLEQTGGRLDFMRLLVVGSDVWHRSDHERLRRLCGARTRLINSYGVAEATIDSTWFGRAASEQAVGRSVPIGRPFAGNRTWVVDRTLAPAPAGGPGELVIGGATLARGYLGRPALTAERFVPSPFGDGARHYRSGDLARSLADGNLELLGRIDHQVKIRGFRVEPGEIEAVLARQPGVREAAVATREPRPGEVLLVAWVAVTADGSLTTAWLKDQLAAVLPAYMVPAIFVLLDELPHGPTGKIDRRSLPEPAATDRFEPERPYVAPQTEAEEVVAEIFASILDRERVGIYDDFFELGGHSLLATRLTSRVRSTFGVDLPLRELFSTPTVASVAAIIEDLLIAKLEALDDEEIELLKQEI